MDIKEFVGLGGIPIVQALVALTKTTIPEFPARYYPGLSVALGILVNVILALLFRNDLQLATAVGVVTGLAAAGLFDYGKTREQTTVK